MKSNFHNIVSPQNTIVSSRETNKFQSKMGVMRITIYPLSGSNIYCTIGCKITLDFLQNYEINYLLIWFYDTDIREFDIVVYGNETIQIYENTNAKGIVKIPFKANQFLKISIFNRNGNSINGYLNIWKVLAYYKFN